MPVTPEDLERFRRMKADDPAPPNPKAHPNWDPEGNEPDGAERAAIEARIAETREAKEREATSGGPVVRPAYDRTRPNGRHLIEDPIVGSAAPPPRDRTCPECGGPLAQKKDRCYRCCPGGRNPAPPSYATVLDALRVVAVALAPLRPADRRRVLDMVTILTAESES